MGLLDELEESYNSIAAGLQENGVPTPSFYQFLAILGLIIVGAFILIAQPFAPTSQNLVVTVLFNSSPVDKALVRIYSTQNIFISESFTGADGMASFENLPKEKILLKASKKGLGEKTVVLNIVPQKTTVSFDTPAQANQTLKITLKVADESTSSGLKGAAITYTFSDNPSKTYTVYSDAEGKAIFNIPAAKTMNLVILHNEYDSKLFSITSQKEQTSYEIKLHKKFRPSALPSASPQFEYGTLRVTVKDAGGNLLDAQIELYDAITNSLIVSKTATEGKASFPNLLSGSGYYLRAKHEGFSDYDGTLSQIIIGGGNELEITMRKGAAQGKANVLTIDEDGSEVPAKVQLFTNEKLVSEASSSGEKTFDLLPLSALESFRFVATSDGKLPAISEFYSADAIPAEITLILQSANPENSALLTVNTKDKLGNELSGAAITVYSESDGITASEISSSSASAQFLLQKNNNYQIIAEYSGGKGAASVLLTEDKTLPIFIGAATEQISLAAFDALTGDPVEATFYITYGGQTFDSCFGSSCSAFAKTLEAAQLRVTANGYFDYETQILPSGDSSPIKINLVPEDLQETYMKFLGIFDSLGRQVQEAQANEEYSAKFLLASPAADKLGIFFRIGKSPSANTDIATISGYASQPSPSAIIKSTSFSQTSPCGNENPATLEYKWLNLEYEKRQMQEVSIKFKLRTKAEKDPQLSFYYRGYAVKGNLFFRIPYDETLQTQAKSASVDWCKAKSTEGSIAIKKKGYYSCNALGCLSLSAEQDGFLSYRDAQARNAKDCDASNANSPDSCRNANMKITAEFSPSDPGKEFSVKVVQQNSKLKFTSYSLNSAPPAKLSSTTLSIPLSNANDYALQIDSLPQEISNEKLSVTIQEASGDLSIGKSLDMKIYGSCGNRLKDCGGGVCAPICIADFFTDGKEEIPPAPVCEEGQFYCLDGICRNNCDASIGKDFGDNITISFQNGKLLVSNSKIKMQIDAILPADAIPLDFIPSQECTPLFSIVADKTKTCYAIENNHLVFRGNELTPSCPLKSIGDNAQGDKSAKLRIGCAGKDFSPVEIPIEVAGKPSRVKTAQFQPRGLSGSASKVFHVINQKQVRRDYSMEELQLQFNFADAYTYAWSGAGTLELRDGETAVDSITYGSSDSYFPNIDNQGGRTPACYDYLCCTGKWCTSPAAQQAFEAFKKMAQKVAEETAFRRGNNFIIEKVLKKPFVFATVIRLIEKANLPAGIQVEDSPSQYGCLDENPKIYVLQAITKDGKNWQYKARIARLYTFNYISPEQQCKVSGITPALQQTETHALETSGNYLALCDFLSSKKSCVQSEKDASFASVEQASSDKQLRPSFMISTFWRIIVLGHVCAPGETLIDFDLPDIRVPRWTVMKCAGAKPVCTPQQSYVFTDVKDNQIRGTVHVGVNALCKPDFAGLAVGAGGFLATYKYPQHADTINALSSIISFAIMGDFRTCAVLNALAIATPSEYRVAKAGLALSCSAISKIKQFSGKIFGSGIPNPETAIPPSGPASAPTSAPNPETATP